MKLWPFGKAPEPQLRVLMVCMGITRRPWERADRVRMACAIAQT